MWKRCSTRSLMLWADPWREDALRAIMETRMLLGDRAGAVAEYERFASRLRSELQTEPLDETIQAYERMRCLAKAPVSRATESEPAVTLVGRHNELATLRDEWQRAARGEGRAIFVGGEAGIGKTTLVQALREIVAGGGGAVLSGSATTHEENAYAALAGVAHTLGADIFAPVGNEDARLRTFEAFADLLEQRARQTAVLVVIEDLHWAGLATFDLLRYLILRLAQVPVLFVGTYREFEVGSVHPLRALRRQLAKTRRCTNMALSTLSRDDVRALACFCAGRSLGDELTQRIYERSDGNPLFVVELVRELRANGPERVPSSISEIVNDRLSRLNEAARSMLQTAAVAGSTPSVELLVHVTGMREADVLLALDDLMTSHFLRQDAGDQFTFVHDVIREAIYEGMRSETVRSTHARVGLALHAMHPGNAFNGIAATAAWHFENGGLPEAAVNAYSTAAEHAVAVYALDEAQRYARKAYEGTGDRRVRFHALRTLEFVAGSRAAGDAQRAYIDELLTLSEGLGSAERADALIRATDFSAGQSAQAQGDALARLEQFVQNTPAYATAYFLRLGEYFSRVGEVRQAKHALQRALDDLSMTHDVEALLRCLTALYVATLSSGDPIEDLQERVQQVGAKIERNADDRISARLAFIHAGALLDRDPEAAYEVSERMLEHARSAGDFWLEALAHRSIGACATRRMLITDAQRHLRVSADLTLMAGRLRDLARVRSWQIMVENRAANFAAASAFGQEGLEAAQACGAIDVAASILANLSNTAVWAGDLTSAERLDSGIAAPGRRARIRATQRAEFAR